MDQVENSVLFCTGYATLLEIQPQPHSDEAGARLRPRRPAEVRVSDHAHNPSKRSPVEHVERIHTVDKIDGTILPHREFHPLLDGDALVENRWIAEVAIERGRAAQFVLSGNAFSAGRMR